MLKASRNAQKYAVSRFFTQKPFLLTHFLTSKCNCKCKICDIWRKKYEPREMTTTEIYQLLNEAKKLNFATI
jgi:MoaA/NifB/PqqE/SkfB family radical SAM enzyme